MRHPQFANTHGGEHQPRFEDRATGNRAIGTRAAIAAAALMLLGACAGSSPATSNESAEPPAELGGEELLGVDETRPTERAETAGIADSSDSAEDDPADAEAPAPARLAVVDEADSVLAVIATHPELTTFASLVAEYPQQQVFTQARGVTIFAPSDAAFGALGAEAVQALAEDDDAFTLFLSAHMAVGNHSLDGIAAGGVFTNALAQQLDVTRSDDVTQVNQSTVQDHDLQAMNGVIHIVDGVLTP